MPRPPWRESLRRPVAGHCVPTSLDQEVGSALGAQAGEKRLAEVIADGGFGRVRRAAEGPFNIVLEAG
jgi:predicted phage gp36 major capsid-like protein